MVQLIFKEFDRVVLEEEDRSRDEGFIEGDSFESRPVVLAIDGEREGSLRRVHDDAHDVVRGEPLLLVAVVVGVGAVALGRPREEGGLVAVKVPAAVVAVGGDGVEVEVHGGDAHVDAKAAVEGARQLHRPGGGRAGGEGLVRDDCAVVVCVVAGVLLATTDKDCVAVVLLV